MNELLEKNEEIKILRNEHRQVEWNFPVLFILKSRLSNQITGLELTFVTFWYGEAIYN